MVSFKRNSKLAFPFIFPAFIVYTIFFIYPAVSGLLFSLYEWKGFSRERTFVGIAHFKELIHDAVFWRALTMNIRIMVIGGLFIFALAFVFLICYNNIRFGKNSIRAMIFLL